MNFNKSPTSDSATLSESTASSRVTFDAPDHVFPSMPTEHFRFRCFSTEDTYELWCENKLTKEQWKLHLSQNSSDYSVSGCLIPFEVVLQFLQVYRIMLLFIHHYVPIECFCGNCVKI